MRFKTVAATLAVAAAILAQITFKNDKVVELSNPGLSDSVIISRIEDSSFGPERMLDAVLSRWKVDSEPNDRQMIPADTFRGK